MEIDAGAQATSCSFKHVKYGLDERHADREYHAGEANSMTRDIRLK